MSEEIEVYHSRDWRISPSVSWRIKDGLDLRLTCQDCDGKGGRELSTLFNPDPEPETWETCRTCYGGKTIRNPDIEQRPRRIPKAYVEHIKKAHFEFLDNKENRRYLTGNKKD